MVWDLRRALLKKEEVESARLTDFEFREMVRAIRLLADALGIGATPLLHHLADRGLDAAIALAALQSGREADEVASLYPGLRAEARRQLVAELGDPAPHRLA